MFKIGTELLNESVSHSYKVQHDDSSASYAKEPSPQIKILKEMNF